MTIELQVLAWSVVLGLVQIGLTGAMATRQRGFAWNISARDGEATPLTGIGARLERAQRNFFETFPLFAAVVLAVVLAQRGSAETALGAQLYLWARIAYVPLYAFGVPYVRSIAWAVALWGLLKLLLALF